MSGAEPCVGSEGATATMPMSTSIRAYFGHPDDFPDGPKRHNRTGWICPRCSRVWAPHIHQCRTCNEGVKR